MANLKMKKKLIPLFLTVALLSGCGFSEKEQGTQRTAVVQGMEKEPVLSYEVPALLPGIRVNQAGYVPKEKKIAVFLGSSLPEQFCVVEEQTGEVVFNGYIEPGGYRESTGEYIGYGDFSELQEQGSYHLQCELLGLSYSFCIGETCHREQLQEGMALLAEQAAALDKGELLSVCRSAAALLLSCELYGQVHEDAAGSGEQPAVILLLRRYAELLLSWQEETDGAVRQENGELLPEQTAWLSAALAKFSYTYQKYDSLYATACLQAADRAWQCLDAPEGQQASSEVLFFAAAELYRASGQKTYHDALCRLGQQLSEDPANEAQAYGTLTYAATKRQVDVELCGTLLGVLLNEAENVAERAKENVFLVGGSIAEQEMEAVLWDALIVAATDYVITNSEYAAILQNYQSYFAGVNEQAYDYITEGQPDAAVGAESVNRARYLMILSEIMSHEGILN